MLTRCSRRAHGGLIASTAGSVPQRGTPTQAGHGQDGTQIPTPRCQAAPPEENVMSDTRKKIEHSLNDLIAISRSLPDIEGRTGRAAPDVIT